MKGTRKHERRKLSLAYPRLAFAASRLKFDWERQERKPLGPGYKSYGQCAWVLSAPKNWYGQSEVQPRSQGHSSSRQKLLAGRRETLGTRLSEVTVLYIDLWYSASAMIYFLSFFKLKELYRRRRVCISWEHFDRNTGAILWSSTFNTTACSLDFEKSISSWALHTCMKYSIVLVKYFSAFLLSLRIPFTTGFVNTCIMTDNNIFV